jgi:hypothetical protein
MPVELEIIRACEFVRVGTQGEFDFESTRPVLLILAEACRKRGIDRALMDVRGATSNLSPDDLAALVNVFSEAVASKRLWLALVHTGDQNYRAKLFAFFSAMRGRKVRAFENFEEALGWLSTLDDVSEEGEIAGETIPIQFDGPKTETTLKENRWEQ